MRCVCALSLAALVSACGPASESMSLALTMPFVSAQSACDTSYFTLNTLSVTATVSGAPTDACSFTIGADLSATGSCDIPYAEIVKYLALEYELTAATSTASLSAVIAVLDLRPDGGPQESDLTIDLSDPTPPDAAVVATPDALLALPVDCEAMDVDTPERFLCDAEVWWRGRRSPDYDVDVDGVSNVDEACAGTLFP